jgi:hypothetical protein
MTPFYIVGSSMTGAVMDVTIYQKDHPSAEDEYDFRYNLLGYRRCSERGNDPKPRERRRKGDAKP